MKKILIIIGTRPEAIKMAPVYYELKKSKQFETYLCVTGQHQEMLQQVLDAFAICPDIKLNVMRHNQSLAGLTQRLISAIDDYLEYLNPNMVLVHGDTTTTFCAGLVAFYRNIRVGHVEAGLRTDDIFSPFPEEFNRRSISMFSFINFAPTEQSKRNLIEEGINRESIVVTGNTVIDSLSYSVERIKTDADLNFAIRQKLQSVVNFDFRDDRYILVTCHRRENQGRPLIDLCGALKQTVAKFEKLKVIVTVHKNPKVRELIHNELGHIDNIILVDPLEYLPFLNLMQHSHFVVTDSGGLQEELPSLGKPVIVYRDTTERPEALRAGTAVLSGANFDGLYNNISRLLENEDEYIRMSEAVNPYGDGRASERIRKHIEESYWD
ncbi:UDP-N-acetylglucosamine 2-epimerase (non-hydrolyzing) [Planktomarina temperata]|nr:UDP-N-acetylglucosamine 2-epimerase (non-hydrolyzing) [Planktomarina temperata]